MRGARGNETHSRVLGDGDSGPVEVEGEDGELHVRARGQSVAELARQVPEAGAGNEGRSVELDLGVVDRSPW